MLGWVILSCGSHLLKSLIGSLLSQQCNRMIHNAYYTLNLRPIHFSETTREDRVEMLLACYNKN